MGTEEIIIKFCIRLFAVLYRSGTLSDIAKGVGNAVEGINNAVDKHQNKKAIEYLYRSLSISLECSSEDTVALSSNLALQFAEMVEKNSEDQFLFLWHAAKYGSTDANLKFLNFINTSNSYEIELLLRLTEQEKTRKLLELLENLKEHFYNISCEIYRKEIEEIVKFHYRYEYEVSRGLR